MDIWVDGSIYDTQQIGGISRIIDEVLPRIGAHWDDGQVTVLTCPRPGRLLPGRETLRYWGAGLYSKLTQGLRNSILLKIIRAVVWRIWLVYCSWLPPAIWFSSYYKKPYVWRGKKVFLVADLIHERFPQLFSGKANDRFRARRRKCLKDCDAIIAISHTTAKDLQQYYHIPGNKIHVAHLAPQQIFKKITDPEYIRGVSSRKPFFLYIGGRVHYKNFSFFAQTFAQWCCDHDVDLVLIGGGQLSREETQWFRKYEVEGRVHFIPGVSDEELRELYHQAVALVYPSLWEGFGIPVLEAMACGCPVIASRIPTTEEIAEDCPIYFEPTDEKQLIAAFDQVLQNRDALSQKISKGLRVAQNYTWDNTANIIISVFRMIGGAIE